MGPKGALKKREEPEGPRSGERKRDLERVRTPEHPEASGGVGPEKDKKGEVEPTLQKRGPTQVPPAFETAKGMLRALMIVRSCAQSNETISKHPKPSDREQSPATEEEIPASPLSV